jgi:hypothetical protein
MQRVVMQFESEQLTPKALANFSPRVGAKRQPWDYNVNGFIKPCKGSAIGERFQRFALIWGSQGCRFAQPRLKLANASVYSNSNCITTWQRN